MDTSYVTHILKHFIMNMETMDLSTDETKTQTDDPTLKDPPDDILWITHTAII